MKKISTSVLQIHNFLKIISDKNRLLILDFLSKEEKCVCQIWQYLDLPQNLASHHLKILKDSNLINSKKEGLKVIYKLNKKNLKNNIKKFAKFFNLTRRINE